MKKNIDIKKAIQQIPVKELREFVEQQTGKNQKFQAAFLKHFEDFFVEKESGDAYVEQVQDAFWDATPIGKFATTCVISAATEQRIWQLRQQQTSALNIVVVVLW